MKSSIRFFQIEYIKQCYYDNGIFNKQRKAKTRKVYYDFLTNYKSNDVNINNVYILDSNEIISNDKKSIMIQLIDVFLGIFRTSFVIPNNKNIYKISCVDKFLPVIERFNKAKSFNINSRYYKKFSFQFFPSKPKTPIKYINSKNSYNNIFYRERKTYRETLKIRKQNENNYKLFE